MREWKQLLSINLALVMLLGLLNPAVVAFATGEEEGPDPDAGIVQEETEGTLPEEESREEDPEPDESLESGDVLVIEGEPETEVINAWEIGAENPADVMATLYDDGTLVISGTGVFIPVEWPEGITNVIVEEGVAGITRASFYDYDDLVSVTFLGDVDTIGYQAFYNCDGLTTVEFAGEVGSIAEDAFSNSDALTGLEFQGDVEKIGDNAFYDCDGLVSVTFLGDVDTIGHQAFYNCDGLTTVEFAGNVNSIAEDAFQDSDALTGLEFQGSVEEIDESAFYHCDGLTAVTFGGEVGSVGGSAFEYCGKLSKVSFGGDVGSIGSYAFIYCSNLCEVTFGGEVGSIGSYVFYDCDGLTAVTFGGDVGSIGFQAFYNCSSLANLVFPGNVGPISSEAFRGCFALTDVSFGGKVGSIASDAFYYCSNLKTVTVNQYKVISGIVESHFPEYTQFIYKEIGEDGVLGTWEVGAEDPSDAVATLYDDGTLVISGNGEIVAGDWPATVQALVVEDGITGILEDAFYNNDNLATVTFEGDVDTIGSSAFYDCSALTSVELLGNVESIGSSAFRYCSQLSAVTFGGDVGEIYYNAFGSCPALETVTVNEYKLLSTLDESVFPAGTSFNYKTCGSDVAVRSWMIGANDETDATATLYADGTLVIDGTGSIAKGNWPTTIEKVVVKGGITNVPERMFYNCDSLTSVEISAPVDYIGGYAFYGCSVLEEITLPNTLETIEYQAFQNSTALKNVYIQDTKQQPSKLNYIGNAAFTNCSSLESINLPDSLTSLGSEAFSGCSNLKEIEIPDRLASISNYAFWGCSSLTSLVIPDTVTYIGSYAFADCKGLISLTVGSDLYRLSQRAFSGCSALASIQWNAENCCRNGNYSYPLGTGSQVFYGAGQNSDGITLTIGKGVESIPDYLFYVSSNESEGKVNLIQVVNNSKNLESIGSFAFYNTDLTSVDLGDVVSHIGESAFNSCKALTSIKIPESMENIGRKAFYNTGLTSVDLENNIAFIGEQAFGQCGAGMTIYGYEGSAAEIYANAEGIPFVPYAMSGTCGDLTWTFDPDTETLTFTGTGAMEDYAEAAPWARYGDQIQEVVLPEGMTALGANVFAGCTQIQEVWFHGDAPAVADKELFQDAEDKIQVYYLRSASGWDVVAWKNCVLRPFSTEEIELEFYANLPFQGAKEFIQFEEGQSGVGIDFTAVSEDALAHYQKYASGGNLVLWSTETDGSGEGYDGYTTNYLLDSDTLYAQWKPSTITIDGQTYSAIESASGEGWEYIYEGEYSEDGCVVTKNELRLTNYNGGEIFLPWGMNVIAEGENIVNGTVTSQNELAMINLIASAGSSLTVNGNVDAYYCNLVTEDAGAITLNGAVNAEFFVVKGSGDVGIYAKNHFAVDAAYVQFRNTGLVEICAGQTAVEGEAFYWDWSSYDIYLSQDAEEPADSYGGGDYLRLKPVDSTQLEKSWTSGSITAELYRNGTLILSGSGMVYDGFWDWSVDKDKVREVIFRDGITGVGNYAFEYCYNLNVVTFDGNIEEILSYAFRDCYALTEVNFGGKVNVIYGGAFYRCSSIENVTVNAFEMECTFDRSVFPETAEIIYKTGGEDTVVDSWLVGVYDETDVRATLYADGTLVIAGTGEFKYGGWPNTIKKLVIEEDISGIAYGMFEDYYELTSVEINSSLVTLESRAFSNCSALTELILPESLEYIGYRAFQGCTSLAEVVIPDSVNTIDSYAFVSCGNLTVLTVGSGLRELGECAFRECSALSEINWNAVWLYYGLDNSSEVFYGAGRDSNGITLTIGPWVEEIPAYLFYTSGNTPEGKVNLTKLVNKSNCLQVIGALSFYNTNLTQVDFNNQVFYIWEGAFNSCTDLNSVTGLENVYQIGRKAFYNTGLSKVYLGRDISYIDNLAFAQCAEDMTIYGYDDTQAEWYANYEGINFVPYPTSGTCGDLEWSFDEASRTLNCTGSGVLSAVGESSPWHYHRDNIEKVVLPEGLTKIDVDSFVGCSHIQEVWFYGDAPVFQGESPFSDAEILVSVYYMENTNGWDAVEWENCEIRPYTGEEISIMFWVNLPFEDAEPHAWVVDTIGGVGVDFTEYSQYALEEYYAYAMDGSLTGWNTEPDGSGESYDGFSINYLTEGCTLYAQWEPAYFIIDGQEYSALESVSGDGWEYICQSNGSELILDGYQGSAITLPWTVDMTVMGENIVNGAITVERLFASLYLSVQEDSSLTINGDSVDTAAGDGSCISANDFVLTTHQNASVTMNGQTDRPVVSSGFFRVEGSGDVGIYTDFTHALDVKRSVSFFNSGGVEIQSGEVAVYAGSYYWRTENYDIYLEAESVNAVDWYDNGPYLLLKPAEKTLILNANGGVWEDGSSGEKVFAYCSSGNCDFGQYRDQVTREGYTLVGWSDAENKVEYSNHASAVLDDGVELYAVWVKNALSIGDRTYDPTKSQSGTGWVYTPAEGEKVAILKLGTAFASGSISLTESLNVEITGNLAVSGDNAKPLISVVGNLFITTSEGKMTMSGGTGASALEVEGSITIENNGDLSIQSGAGGSAVSAVEDVTVINNGVLTAVGGTNGYAFYAGEVLDISGTGKIALISGGTIAAVSSGNLVLDPSLKTYCGKNASTAVRGGSLVGSQYIRIEPKSVVVNLNLNGGDGDEGLPLSVVFSQTTENEFTLEGTVPERFGYNFAGWNSMPDGSGIPYAFGETYSLPETTDELALYATWDKREFDYKVEEDQLMISLDGLSTETTTVMLAAYDDDGKMLEFLFGTLIGGVLYFDAPENTEELKLFIMGEGFVPLDDAYEFEILK